MLFSLTNPEIAIFMMCLFLFAVLLGFPIAFTLLAMGVGFGYYAYFDPTRMDHLLDNRIFSLLVSNTYTIMDNNVLTAVPLFLFMGYLVERAGIVSRLFFAIRLALHGLPASMAVAALVTCALFSTATGIIGAVVTLMGLLAWPAMVKAGYDKKFASGVICSGGCLGILIPPSIMLVLMADRMAMSVGDLFLGAVFPGLLLSSLYIIYLLVYGAVRPELAPRIKNQITFNLTDLVELAKAIVPPTLLIVAVLGSIFFGFATPTEAAGVGAAGALALAAVYGSLNLKVLKEVSRETTKTTAFIFGILIGATAFSLVLRGLGGDELIERALLGLPFGATGIVITILVLTFILGFFLDWIELTLIILPLVAPVVISLGFDPIWFTVLFAVCLQTSFLTPPVGSVSYTQLTQPTKA